ncbi:hypothetical protein MMC24_002321 [Lignoscripta atroalba]|nr:hypothetical protein [Lignoscripta atroalba]
MLNCYACARTYIRIVFGDVSRGSSKPLQNITFHGGRCPRRSYAAAVTAARQGEDSAKHVSPPTLEQRRGAVAKGVQFKRESLEQELRYLRDPLKLAENTVSLLRQHEHQKALEILRVASRDTACTVSWNHVIDYNMASGRVTAAIKAYNEMKKRAQPPDAHTYTILLRGLAWHTEYLQSFQRALSIYHSMSAENSPVKPSIIHTNAVLKVCARAGEIDSLFDIAAKLPVRGKGAPDNFTFTTILNAIRTAGWNGGKDLRFEDKEQYAARRQRAVLQGRRMWDDIIGRWRRGDIMIDEEVVCAMGRLLLLGYMPQDFDDILSLVEQTMAIPRQVSRINNSARKSYSSATEALLSAPTSADIGTDHVVQENNSVPSAALSTNHTDYDDPSTTPGSEFDALPPSESTVISYARPGRNTLSLLVDACIRLHEPRAAHEYWSLLTAPPPHPNIDPDSENFHMYLRLLRMNRASRSAAGLVDEMVNNNAVRVQAKTFRIAMSACVRDDKNPRVTATALKLLRTMINTLEEPDLKSCEMFLEVMRTGGGNDRNWKVLKQALKELGPCVGNLKSLLAYGRIGSEEGRENVRAVSTPDEPFAGGGSEPDVDGTLDSDGSIHPSRRPAYLKSSTSETGRINDEGRMEVKSFASKMIGAYDKVLVVAGEEMSGIERQECMEERAALAAWVTRIGGKVVRNKKMASRRPAPAKGGVRKGEGGGDDGRGW